MISTYKKAILNNDHVLAETLFELISYRREKRLDHDLLWKKRKKILLSIGDFENYDTSSPLSKWNQAILKGLLDFGDYTEGDVVDIIEILETQGNEEDLLIARRLLMYKQDISIVYVTKDHWQAVDMLEKLCFF